MLTVINFRILFFFLFFFKPAAYVWGHIIEIINQEPQHWVTTFTSFANATVCGLPKCSLIYILTTRLSSIFLPWEPAQTQKHWLFSFSFFYLLHQPQVITHCSSVYHFISSCSSSLIFARVQYFTRPPDKYMKKKKKTNKNTRCLSHPQIPICHSYTKRKNNSFIL